MNCYFILRNFWGEVRKGVNEVKKMKFTWRTELVSWLLLAYMFALGAWTWSVAPERIPIHWGITGQPDRYGGKVEAILLPLALALGLYLLLLVLPRFDPRYAHYRFFSGVYHLIRTVLVAFFAAVYTTMMLWARSVQVDTSVIVPLMVGLLFVILGNYMGKLRSTWFVGIRTPWTLSSEESWNKTHRLGGKVFAVLGFVFIAASLLKREWAFYTALGLLGAGVIFLVIYSYFIWRHDTRRTLTDKT